MTDFTDYLNYTANTPGQVVAYTYDLQNRLIARALDSDGDGTVDLSTIFAYHNNQIVLHFESADASKTLDASDLSHRYFWNPTAVDQIFADESIDDLTTPGAVLLPLNDHLGTVRDLAEHDQSTNQTTITNHRTYDSFGTLVSETDPSLTTLFAFTGRPLDQATALQNNYHRWYDAQVGRWISQDPIGFEGEDTNVYCYVDNKPMNYVDPTGLWPDTNFWYERPPEAPAAHDSGADTQDAAMQGGKDVTAVLTAGLQVVEKILEGLPASTFMSLYNSILSTVAGTWDIEELKNAGNDKFGKGAFVETEPNRTSTKDAAEGTVTINGSVYWAAEANYVLWGLLHSVYADKIEHEASWYSDIGKAGFGVLGIAYSLFMPSECKALMQAKDAIPVHRSRFADRMLENENDTPGRRSPGLGIPGRLAFTEVGFYNLNWSLALKYQLNGKRDSEPRRCISSKQECNESLSFKLCSDLYGNTQEASVYLVIKKVKDQNNTYHITDCWIPGMSDADAKVQARAYLESLGYKNRE